MNAVNETKPAYTSLTVVSALLVVLVTAAKMFGYDISDILAIQEELVVLVGMLVVLYGRFRATKQVTLF